MVVWVNREKNSREHHLFAVGDAVVIAIMVSTEE